MKNFLIANILCIIFLAGCNKSDKIPVSNKETQTQKEFIWQPVVNLTNGNESTPELSESCIGASGDTLHMVYSGYFDNRHKSFLLYRNSTDGGTTWSAERKLLSIKRDIFMPKVAVSGPLVFIAWNGGENFKSQIFIKRSTDGGVNWEDDAALTPENIRASTPNLAISENNVYLAWTEEKFVDFYAGKMDRKPFLKISRNGGKDWGNDIQVVNNLIEGKFVLAASGKNVYLTWVDKTEKEIYFKLSKDNADNWEPEKRLAQSKHNLTYPNITASDNFIHIIYNEIKDYKSYTKYLRSDDNGIHWNDSVSVITKNSFFPNISSSGKNVNIIWQDDRIDQSDISMIYTRSSTDGGLIWGNEFALTENVGFSSNPSIVTSGNEIHSVWLSHHIKANDIYYRRFSFREFIQKEKEKTPDTTKFNTDSEKIIYEATEGVFKTKSGEFFDSDCNETVTFETQLIDLNSDGTPELFITLFGSCYGKYGCQMNSYFKNNNGKWVEKSGWIGCYEIIKLNTINSGYSDIQLGQDGPIWRWNGKDYEIFKKK